MCKRAVQQQRDERLTCWAQPFAVSLWMQRRLRAAVSSCLVSPLSQLLPDCLRGRALKG